jgi:hypothetical protein
MVHRKTSKRSKARTMLRPADFEQSKNAVLHSLGAASSQESYGHAIDEFIGWYRFFLEQKNLADFWPATPPFWVVLSGSPVTDAGLRVYRYPGRRAARLYYLHQEFPNPGILSDNRNL